MLLVSHDRDFLDRVATSVIASEGGGKWLEYAGGYSDMMIQRGGTTAPAHKAAEPRKNKRKSRQSDQRAAKGPAKLSYKDKYALEKLPKRIAALQSEIDAHNKVLADSDLFVRGPAAFEAAAATLQEAERALAEAEDQWLRLEEAREESERA